MPWDEEYKALEAEVERLREEISRADYATRRSVERAETAEREREQARKDSARRLKLYEGAILERDEWRMMKRFEVPAREPFEPFETWVCRVFLLMEKWSAETEMRLNRLRQQPHPKCDNGGENE